SPGTVGDAAKNRSRLIAAAKVDIDLKGAFIAAHDEVCSLALEIQPAAESAPGGPDLKPPGIGAAASDQDIKATRAGLPDLIAFIKQTVIVSTDRNEWAGDKVGVQNQI